MKLKASKQILTQIPNEIRQNVKVNSAPQDGTEKQLGKQCGKKVNYVYIYANNLTTPD